MGRESFKSHSAVFASATRSGSVTPSTTTLLDFKALYVGGAGDISIQHTTASSTAVFSSIPAGTILPVSGGLVTTATATSIVWLDW